MKSHEQVHIQESEPIRTNVCGKSSDSLTGLPGIELTRTHTHTHSIKVESPDSMRRVSGTALGGGTFFGLCKLLTRCETFDEALDAADRGDSRRVNLLVSDIYGGAYDRVGLPGTLTASFFGKVASAMGVTRPASSGSHQDVLLARMERRYPFWIRMLRVTAPLHGASSAFAGIVLCQYFGILVALGFLGGLIITTLVVMMALYIRRTRRKRGGVGKNVNGTLKLNGKVSMMVEDDHPIPNEVVFRDEDIARALVTMISQNITQIAYLNSRLHSTKRVIFTGNFLRHNTIALRTLSENLRVWSGGEVEAIFMEHEGFFGAIGAFLKTCPGVTEMSRRSSIHAPEEGDDGFYLSSPKQSPASANAVVPDLRLM